MNSSAKLLYGCQVSHGRQSTFFCLHHDPYAVYLLTVRYVTLHHTFLWVIEPSVLHILAQISARVLEGVFFAFPHSLNPCDMKCPAGVERQYVEYRFHSFAKYCKLV